MLADFSVQAYSLVLVVEKGSYVILAASDNARDLCGKATEEMIGSLLSTVFPESVTDQIGAVTGNVQQVFPLPELPGWDNANRQLIVHPAEDSWVLEIEPRRTWPKSGDYAARLNDFTEELIRCNSTGEVVQKLCEEVAFHLNADRVIHLRFDQYNNSITTHDWCGPGMDSFVGVHYFDADIPAAARRAQLENTVYFFSDEQSPLVPLVGDVSAIALPVLRWKVNARHPNDNYVEYLRQQGLRSLGYLSLVIEGELWGSLYIHARKPVYLDYQMRSFFRVIGRVAQQSIAYQTTLQSIRLKEAGNAVRDQLQANIERADSLIEGLTAASTTLLDLIPKTTGAAICVDNVLHLFGNTPTEDQVNSIVSWMKERPNFDSLWKTDQLEHRFEPAVNYRATAAGLLYLSLDQEATEWIIWFRPEAVQTVTYGSKDSKDSKATNGPQRDFHPHSTTRHGYSLPWTEKDVNTALALQVYVQEIVVRRYSRMRSTNQQLREANEDLKLFSYTISHDLRAPLRGIRGYVDALREDYGDHLKDSARDYLQEIDQNAQRMGRFMQDVLELSRVGRSSIIINELDVPTLVKRVLRDLNGARMVDYCCEVQTGMDPIRGDQTHLVGVFTNLLSNAIKYSSKTERPVIRVGQAGKTPGGTPIFYVSDNGIGIPSDMHERVFDLFVRLVDDSQYEGTGLGLALVRRIINFHGGKIWVENVEEGGTRFLFYTDPEPV